MDAAALLTKAVAEWRRGDHYAAHETLEEVAEAVEDDDAEYEIALALVHVAASMHKLANDVGANAVPGKLEGALEVLDRAPATWRTLDLARLRAQIREVLAKLARNEKPSLVEL
jgi:hypothetical protein